MSIKEEIKKNLKNFELWKITLILANIEKRILELKKQGESSGKRILKKLSNKRAGVRELLLEKLKLWRKGELRDDCGYSDATEYNKDEIRSYANVEVTS